MKTTNLQNKIMDLLQWSSQEYEENKFEYYTRWCDLHSKRDLSKYAQILHNPSISYWFDTEFSKIEKQFEMVAQAIPNNTIHYRMHYRVMIKQLFDKYPSALFEDIKSNKMFQGIFNPN